jgi:HK97 family phage major capsid protein
MKTSNELLEQRGVLDTEFANLANLGDKTTPENEVRMDAIIADLKTLNEEIKKSESREQAKKEVEARAKSVPFLINPTKSDNENQVKEQFSMRKMILDQLDKKAPQGLEAEMVQQGVAEAREVGISPKGLMLPAFLNEKRAAVNTTSTSDTPKTGYYVATDTLVDQRVDVFRNQLVLVQAGAKYLPGLVGNVSMPKKTSASTAAWLTETGAITPNNSVNTAITMSPKRVGAAIPYTKTFLRQTTLGVDNWLKDDMFKSQAIAVETAALIGGGSNEPIGISSALTTTGGTNLIAMGTNGLAPTWASIVELQKQVGLANANINNCAYIFNNATRGKMKTVVRDAGSGLFLWGDGTMVDSQGNVVQIVNGERAFVTNMVRSNLTKGSSSGVCSEAFYGDFSDLVIGSWGGLDIVVDEYTLALSNQIQIGVNGYYDVAILHEGSFATIKDYLTT